MGSCNDFRNRQGGALMLLYLSAAAAAYLIGSLNPAIAFSEHIYHRDIRICGSGNPGFTNFRRTFGSRYAWWVLVLDLGKAAAVTAVFAWLFERFAGERALGAAFTGLFVLLGHICPVWHGFRGGKGFLAYLAVIWFVNWHAGLIALAVMLLLLALTKYMSLSTVTAMLSCPVTLLVRHEDWKVVLLCAASVLIIALRHRENFRRLRQGTENRFSLHSATRGSS